MRETESDIMQLSLVKLKRVGFITFSILGNSRVCQYIYDL